MIGQGAAQDARGSRLHKLPLIADELLEKVVWKHDVRGHVRSQESGSF